MTHDGHGAEVVYSSLIDGISSKIK
jgi:hypothetical protein